MLKTVRNWYQDIGHEYTGTFGLLVVTFGLILLVLSTPGCMAKVGSSFTTDPNGRATMENPSPVTLSIEDADKKGVANGTGPARFTSITEGEVQTMQTGTTPRDLWFRLPDGTQLNLSSGTDINIEGATFNPKTGAFSVQRFGTSASEPIRAGNEAYDRLIGYWAARDEASADVLRAELDAIKAVSPGFFDVLSVALKAAGIPIP